MEEGGDGADVSESSAALQTEQSQCLITARASPVQCHPLCATCQELQALSTAVSLEQDSRILQPHLLPAWGTSSGYGYATENIRAQNEADQVERETIILNSNPVA